MRGPIKESKKIFKDGGTHISMCVPGIEARLKGLPTGQSEVVECNI
jgi:hypothetical protein